MIRSMTGYARAELQNQAGQITWELRSVNHRYLDLQLRLPEEFRGLESELRTMAAECVSRGKVEAQLRYSTEIDGGNIKIDRLRLQQVLDALELVREAAGASSQIDLQRVLAWPGVVSESSADFAPLQALALETYKAALDDFAQTREREGERLRQYLMQRCELMESLVAAVRKRLPEVRGGMLDKVRERCRELGVDVDPGRLEQELALLAQRLDVDEEMSRLATHIGEVRRTLGRDDAVGRRLDFLMQELNREANTLSSKSQDAEMTRCAVEMKVLIEQMREQVQNVE